MRRILRFDQLRASGAEQAAAAMAGGRRRGHRAAAIHRRHHRQAQGRHAHATATSAPRCSIYKAWSDPQRISAPGEDKVICVLPLFHIYALTSVLLRGLVRGQRAAAARALRCGDDAHDIEVKKATVFPGVPTMWIALANTPGHRQARFLLAALCGSGGAPLPVEVAERFEKLTGQRLGGGWGMTETVARRHRAAARWHAARPARSACRCPASTWTSSRSTTRAGALQPGEKGEIRIKGPNVTKGYWNAPEETAAAFVDGYLLTGDIGYMDEDGYFYLVDRKKDMIISGGFNVYPRTIEEAIYEHPSVAEVMRDRRAGRLSRRGRQGVRAVEARRRGLHARRAARFLADKIGRHEMPAHLEFRDALPKTAVGKLSKKELIEEERQKSSCRRMSCHPGARQQLHERLVDAGDRTMQEKDRTMVDAVIVSTARTPIGKSRPRRLQHHPRRRHGRPRHRARRQARRHRARRRRGRDAGLRQSRRRDRRQHRAPGAIRAGLPVTAAGADRQPLLLLGPAGDRARRAQHHAGRRAGRGRRRAGVDQPRADEHEHQVLPQRVDRRAQGRALHADDRDRRHRRQALRHQPREAGRVRADEPAAHGRRRRRPAASTPRSCR